MEKIVENIRLHNIHALLVIGGFEVRGAQGSMRGRMADPIWSNLKST